MSVNGFTFCSPAKVFARSAATLAILLLCACGFVGETLAYRHWHAMAALLTEQGMDLTLAYHVKEEERREEMRAGVRGSRARFEAGISALRGKTEASPFGGETAQRQLRLLESYEALAVWMEAARLAEIEGAIGDLEGSRIVNDCLFAVIDTTLAEQMQIGLLTNGEPVLQALTLDQRAHAHAGMARCAVRRADGAALQEARMRLIEDARAMRALAPAVAAPAPRTIFSMFEPEAKRRERDRYFAEMAGHIAQQADAIEQMAAAFGQATTGALSAIKWRDSLKWVGLVSRMQAPAP